MKKNNIAEGAFDFFLKAIREGTIIEPKPDGYVISLPLVLSSGHFLEIHVKQLHPQGYIALSDAATVISDLELSGVRISGKKKTLLEGILKRYELQCENDEIIAKVRIEEAGQVFLNMVQALYRLGDFRLFEKMQLIKETDITKSLRAIITRVRAEYKAGLAATVSGVLRKRHRVDFIIENGRPLAIKAIDAKKYKTLETSAESWAFRCMDIRKADKQVGLVSVYDSQNENWNDELLTIIEEPADHLCPIQDVAAIESLTRPA